MYSYKAIIVHMKTFHNKLYVQLGVKNIASKAKSSTSEILLNCIEANFSVSGNSCCAFDSLSSSNFNNNLCNPINSKDDSQVISWRSRWMSMPFILWVYYCCPQSSIKCAIFMQKSPIPSPNPLHCK